MEQRSQDFQERARRRELTDRELYGISLNLGKDDLTTAGGLLHLVNTNEEKNFKSIALADQVLKDRRYLITKHYFLELADGTFQTWRDLLYMDEGIFSDVYEEFDLLTRQVWNYGYFKTSFAVDDFSLDTTLARVFNDPPYLGDWNIRCPTHTQGGDLGFAWHITRTSKQIYTISRLTTELCPSFLPLLLTQIKSVSMAYLCTKTHSLSHSLVSTAMMTSFRSIPQGQLCILSLVCQRIGKRITCQLLCLQVKTGTQKMLDLVMDVAGKQQAEM
jgi:hypothetical protein